MGRLQRVNLAGMFCHVMARGNNRAPIFLTEADYQFYCRLLTGAVRRFDIALHAFCLMPNHIHLLIELLRGHLSESMHWLQSIYAREWNAMNGRVGHVFQGRFVSKVVLGEAGLLQVSRYIHLNPVEAGLVTGPEDWRWSSMRAYAGAECDVPVDTGTILKLKGPTAYQEFVAGNGEPIPEARWYSADPAPLPAAHPDTRREEWLAEAEELLRQECRNAGVDPADLRSGNRARAVSRARRTAANRLREELYMPCREIARLLGLRSASAVSHMVRDR